MIGANNTICTLAKLTINKTELVQRDGNDNDLYMVLVAVIFFVISASIGFTLSSVKSEIK